MLAIKTVLAAKDGVATLVFDEVDAGISGETAAQVGQLMDELGEAYQVICITHHAAIAARAGRHLSVSKSTEGGRTRTHVQALGREERLEELARMMGGDGRSAAGKKLAAQMMKAG
jgi:DNA repair protein RecN (Recombination protein N)